jgi:DNA processing protein
MRRPTYTDDQLCILALASTTGIGPATINELIAAAQKSGSSLCCLLELETEELTRRFEMSPGIARLIGTLDSPRLAAKSVLDLLDRANVHPIFRSQAGYPEKLEAFLQRSAPPVLFIAGEEKLLSRPCVAVVGSRRPSAMSNRAAYRFACGLARRGTVIVSGGARGIDTAAHQGAADGGATAVVPPTGIVTFRWRGIDRSALGPQNQCIVGQFPPRDRWRTRNALQRNHSIVALSDAVVGFEPRDHGGTWRSCCAALRMGKPLFVVTARSDAPHARGHEKLVRSGAVALSPRHMPTPEEFQQLSAEYSPPAEPSQPDLFDPALPHD